MKQRKNTTLWLSMLCVLLASEVVLAPRLWSAPVAPSSGSPEDAFMHENMVAMDRMMAGMNVPSTGDVDRDFTAMMIPHHQGGIDMAQALLRYGKDPELRALAQRIIDKQHEEILLMSRIGGAPAPASAPADHQHMSH